MRKQLRTACILHFAISALVDALTPHHALSVEYDVGGVNFQVIYIADRDFYEALVRLAIVKNCWKINWIHFRL